MIGWVFAGIIVAGALIFSGPIIRVMSGFWDNVRTWLNNAAADAVEKTFGIAARNRLIKATSTVDRVFDKLRNRAVVYSKKHDLDTFFLKTTLAGTADVSSLSPDVVSEIDKNREIMSSFEYRS